MLAVFVLNLAGGISLSPGGGKHGGTALSLLYADTLNGGFYSVGTGLINTTVDTIVLDSLPSGATVRKAYLVWTIVSTIPDSHMSFAGNPLSATLVGRGPDPCRGGWGDSAFTYVAEVTQYVTGNGAYELSGYPTNTEGASLVVVYEEVSEPRRNVVIYAGGYTIEGGLYYEYRWDVKEFLAADPVGSAKISYIFYDGQDIPNGSQCGREYIFYDVETLDSGFTTIAGHQGAYWDNLTFDVTAYTSGGWDSVRVGYGTAPDEDQSGCTDCIGVAACAFQVETETPTGAWEFPWAGKLLAPSGSSVRLIRACRGELVAYSASGRRVAVLASGLLEPGTYTLKGLPKGVYSVVLVGERSEVVRVVLK